MFKMENMSFNRVLKIAVKLYKIKNKILFDILASKILDICWNVDSYMFVIFVNLEM